MNKKTIERIATIALAAFLVGYFVYQVAYGYTIGPNGTMTMTQGDVSATFRAPPGTNVTHFGIIGPGPTTSSPTSMQTIKIANSTWTMYNRTILNNINSLTIISKQVFGYV